jgi:hypothetical protein
VVDGEVEVEVREHLLLRSPTRRRTGGGLARTSVGVAKIRSSSARSGCSNTSMTSSTYRPARCASQSAARVRSARTPEARPLTYKRNAYMTAMPHHHRGANPSREPAQSNRVSRAGHA